MHIDLQTRCKWNGIGILSECLIERDVRLVAIEVIAEATVCHVFCREVVVQALCSTFGSTDIKYIYECTRETSQLVSGIKARHDTQVDDVLLEVLCVISIVTSNDACIAVGGSAGDGSCIDDIANAPCRSIAGLTAHQGSCICAALSRHVSLVDDVLQGDETRIALAATCYGSHLMMPSEGATLINNKVTYTRVTVVVATQVTEESLNVFCRTIDDKVLDSVSLSVERATPAQVNVLCNGCMLNALHVDIVHQACTQIVLSYIDHSREPFQLVSVANLIESVFCLLNIIEVEGTADVAYTMLELMRANEARWRFCLTEEPEALVVGSYCCHVRLNNLVVLVPVHGKAGRAVEGKINVVGTRHAEAIGAFAWGRHDENLNRFCSHVYRHIGRLCYSLDVTFAVEVLNIVAALIFCWNETPIRIGVQSYVALQDVLPSVLHVSVMIVTRGDCVIKVLVDFESHGGCQAQQWHQH